MFETENRGWLLCFSRLRQDPRAARTLFLSRMHPTFPLHHLSSIIITHSVVHAPSSPLPLVPLSLSPPCALSLFGEEKNRREGIEPSPRRLSLPYSSSYSLPFTELSKKAHTNHHAPPLSLRRKIGLDWCPGYQNSTRFFMEYRSLF